MNYENITLDKNLYAHPTKSFSEVLEEKDPSSAYVGTELENLDAFSRQLKRFDIKVKGADSDLVAKFFTTGSSAALFPEYVARAVRSGIEEESQLSDIIAATTKIDGMDYRSITSIPSDDEKSLAVVGEGAKIPETYVKTQENLVKLFKRGRMLIASYEAIKFQRIDLFTVTLKQIGAYIARQQFNDAVGVILNGDGNSNAAAVISSATADTLTYSDLLDLYKKLDPYSFNTIIVSPVMMNKIMQLSEFKNPLTGINFTGTGNPGTPLGAKLIKSTAVPDDKIIALDNRCALEMIVASDVAVEYDKLIDRQLERAAITTTAGFAKIFGDASAVLDI